MSIPTTETDGGTGGRRVGDQGRDREAGAADAKKPRNLVLCSDGTGNSAGKGRGTNVWLFYEALDRRHASVVQLAIHDDGVGTSSNTILAALGGAFGFGLARNVRELYSWLCKHYQEGDQIYLVGFSRGAFTVRCLAAMIATFGIIKWKDPSDRHLQSWVWEIWFAYKDAQRGAEQREKHSFDYDEDCSWIGKFLDRFRPRKRPEFFDSCEIKFLGVWDTVDAYGLPVDELKEAFAWISRKLLRWWPLHYLALTRFTDNKLNTSVKNAYHAVAIDDERHTFHPVLWDEPGDASKGQSIQQVWFAGMHSDVGGGYERRSLSLVALNWMMEKARDHGLKFDKDRWDHIDKERDSLGPMHDSRSGLAAYYRYRPRDVQSLCDERNVARPLVHASVLDRIWAQRGEEAPGVLPPRFEVEGQTAFPEAAALRPDKDDLVRLKDLHLCRGALHNLLVGWTVVLLTVILVLRGQAADTTAPSWSLFGIGYLVAMARSLIPEVIGDALSTLRVVPFYTLLLACTFGLLWSARHALDDRIRGLRRAAWNSQFEPAPRPWPLRTLVWVCRQFRRLVPSSVDGKRRLARAFAVVVLLAATLFVADRWRDGVLLPPEPHANPPLVDVPMPGSFEIDFETKNPGLLVGPVLERGERYAIEVKVTDPWRDGGREATPEGLSQALTGLARWLSLWRLRDWRYPAFALLGGVGGENGRRFKIGDGSEVPSPLEEDSRLVVFVNDTTCYVCPSGPWAAYDDNVGTARVTIRRLPREPPGMR